MIVITATNRRHCLNIIVLYLFNVSHYTGADAPDVIEISENKVRSKFYFLIDVKEIFVKILK